MKKLFGLILLTLPIPVFAHVGDHSYVNWTGGLLHPLSGIDHLLALMAIGVWLAQTETRVRVAQVLGFAALLAVGIGMGVMFPEMTFETGIVATLMVLGFLLACAVQGSLFVKIWVVGTTAIIHGFVHGTELPPGAGVMPFASALVASSALALSTAVVLGIWIQTYAKGLFARILGAGLVLFGLGIAF